MKVNELQNEVMKSVLDRYRFINVEYIEWWDDTIYDIKEIGKKIGINIENMYFSGFSSQGDGASFEGSYQYQKGSVKAIQEHAPKDKELIEIVKNLQKLQRRFFYQLYADVKPHGLRSVCSIINVSGNEDFSHEIHNDAEDGVSEFLQDFIHWSYKQLENEYEYLTSNESVTETLKTNEFSFTPEGEDWDCFITE